MNHNDFKKSSLLFLARGPSLTTAYQSALYAKEMAKISSEATPVSTFNHEGVECLNQDSNLVFFSSDEYSFKLNNHFIQRILMKMDSNKILYITNQKSTKLTDKLKAQFSKKFQTFTHKIHNPFLASIMEIFSIQILLYKIAENRGIKPGKFYYSKKITRNL
ncbi:MAG: SIS domain-containing protein [Promethearchaeia archaeon]